jgi:hypothetical protein
MTLSLAAAAACAPEVTTAAALCEREATAVARSQFGELGAALSLCAGAATAIAAMVIEATVSVPRQWARLRSARLLRERTTAVAAATTPTATGFARTGTIRTERRDDNELWRLITENIPQSIRALRAAPGFSKFIAY